jgi:hypothetical protein
MYRLRLPLSTAHHMREANKSTAQPKDDDLTDHYEFNWCLRSPLGGRLLMQSVTQYRHRMLRTRSRQIYCITLPHTLPRSPGFLLRLQQEPASPTLLYLAKDFASRAGFLLLFTTSTRLLVELYYVSLRILRHEPGSCYYLRQAPASSLNFTTFR